VSVLIAHLPVDPWSRLRPCEGIDEKTTELVLASYYRLSGKSSRYYPENRHHRTWLNRRRPGDVVQKLTFLRREIIVTARVKLPLTSIRRHRAQSSNRILQAGAQPRRKLLIGSTSEKVVARCAVRRGNPVTRGRWPIDCDVIGP
jgi:hypothetical protein